MIKKVYVIDFQYLKMYTCKIYYFTCKNSLKFQSFVGYNVFPVLSLKFQNFLIPGYFWQPCYNSTIITNCCISYIVTT